MKNLSKTNSQIHKFTNSQIHKFTNSQIHKLIISLLFLCFVTIASAQSVIYAPITAGGTGININTANTNVGIGVYPPTEKLDINGNINIYGSIRFRKHGYDNIYFDATNNILKFGIGPANPIMTLTSNIATINGNTILYGALDIKNTTSNTTRIILARLAEGNTTGTGTFLGVQAYDTQPVNANSFAIEHKFFGVLNSAINFKRGGNSTGGYITISVDNGTERFKFSNEGLSVHGKILAEEFEIVGTVPASDYVFESNYKLRSLKDVESFIAEHKHLPEVKSAAEFKANGYKVGQMDDVLLRKVEELTLYTIELNKQLEAIKAELAIVKGGK